MTDAQQPPAADCPQRPLRSRFRQRLRRGVGQRLPSIYMVKEYADLGGLITYGPSDLHQYHRAATFVDKIFKGAKPADLAIEQPTKFELVVNLKTAKALGVTIPQSLLLRADHLIE